MNVRRRSRLSLKSSTVVILAMAFWFGLLTFFYSGIDIPSGGEIPVEAESAKKMKLSFGADEEKRAAVKGALLHAWHNYRKLQWGQDELRPVDGKAQNWLALGLTVVDSLGTLWIAGERDEFDAGVEFVLRLNFDERRRDVSLFETTIRVLGGLLSAHSLSGDVRLLHKAADLADRFLPAFDTPTGIPLCSIELKSGAARNPGWTSGASILSEVGTLQLEFAYLSHHLNRSIYREKAEKVFHVLAKADKPYDALYPVYVSPDTGQFTREHITLGALGDSFYEYLLKYWIFENKKEPKWRRLYDEAMAAVDKHLVFESEPNKLIYIAELIGGQKVPKMDHLVCFAGGMFALGAQGETAARHMELGKGLTRTCHEMYNRTATGIASEIVRFEGSNDFVVPPSAAHYLLRPDRKSVV